jgi:hypothetical protein
VVALSPSLTLSSRSTVVAPSVGRSRGCVWSPLLGTAEIHLLISSPRPRDRSSQPRGDSCGDWQTHTASQSNHTQAGPERKDPYVQSQPCCDILTPPPVCLEHKAIAPLLLALLQYTALIGRSSLQVHHLLLLVIVLSHHPTRPAQGTSSSDCRHNQGEVESRAKSRLPSI